MVLFILLGVVVLAALVVLGVLFFMLSKEQKREEDSAVPVTDIAQLKKEMTSPLLEPNKFTVLDKEPDVIPPFSPRVSLPTQEVRSPLEDNAYKKRAQELEDELRIISQKADGQSSEARQMIETLTKENESLKSQKANLEEAQAKLTLLQVESSSLKTENVNLQTQLEATNAKVHLLEEQMTAVKMQMGEEISRANATVSELTREKESLLAAPKPEPDEAMVKELEGLKIEQIQLKQRYQELEEANHKLQDQNTQLVATNEDLQYELIKAKAQSSGLERVSFNYKNQLEDFFRKMNAMQVSHDQVSQVKSRLEGTVEAVKLQNEELLKKDQLTQFELEKNRSRLFELEREHADLKARTLNKDAQ